MVEVLVVLLVVAIVMGAAWTLFGHGVTATKRIGGALDAQQELRVRLQELVHELQAARRIFYPSPGGKSQPGVGFVDRRGHAVMVFAKEEGGEQVLYRADLTERTRTVLTRGVETFRATVPEVPAGRAAEAVNLTFGMPIGGGDAEAGEAGRTIKTVTSVTLRAREEELPE